MLKIPPAGCFIRMVLNMAEYDIKSIILRTTMNKNEKNRKDRVKKMKTYLVKREFSGAVTVDHVIEKIIHINIKK